MTGNACEEGKLVRIQTIDGLCKRPTLFAVVYFLVPASVKMDPYPDLDSMGSLDPNPDPGGQK